MTDFDPQRGIDFPVHDGRLSSMATGREVFTDTARPVDPSLAEDIAGTANWRKDYMPGTRRLVEVGMASKGGTLAMSRAGLDSLHRQFRFTRNGRSGTVAEAFSRYTEPGFSTGEVVGTGRPHTQLEIPYHGAILTGAKLRHQCDVWVAKGIVEPSFADAILSLAKHREWLDLSGTDVAVLGAGAEMGPLRCLLDWGATVWALDLPKPAMWSSILADAATRAGRIRVPVANKRGYAKDMDPAELAEVAGADLLNEGPEIRTWLASIGRSFTLGNYVYADGPLHVRISLAIDAISTELIAGGHDLTLAWLATPTDVFAAPTEAVGEARRRWASAGLRGLVRRPLGKVGLFEPNYPKTIWTAEGVEYGICDCMVAQQGPNYLLAKRLQRWRAMVARSEGTRVSLNVAPSTRTKSVVKNKALAAAYAGAGRFGLEIFQPDTSNAIMAALLVHDLRNPASTANPGVDLAHPMQLFIDGACHGGLWRSPYAARSVLGLAAVTGMFERRA